MEGREGKQFYTEASSSEKRGNERGQNDDLPPTGQRLHRNRNTLPKARQKSGPPPEQVYQSNAPSRTVSGENINSQIFYNRARSQRRDDSKTFPSNSSLPRSRPQRGRGRGSYNSLNRSSSNNRSNAESNFRGRGRLHGSGSLYREEKVSRAPSERKINSLKRRSQVVQSTISFTEERRSSSVPRKSWDTQNQMTTSLSGSTIWKPDGKCPSFADILKGSSTQDLTAAQGEEIYDDVTKDKKDEHHFSVSRETEIILQENVATFHEIINSGEPENHQKQKSEAEIVLETCENFPQKPIQEDSLSITSQKENTFNNLKSYATILTEGMKKKVTDVFKPKPKEMKHITKFEDVTNCTHPQEETILSSEEKNEVITLTDEEQFKPSIPGLVFRTDLVRRTSKKKRKSRSTSMLIEADIDTYKPNVEKFDHTNESVETKDLCLEDSQDTTEMENYVKNQNIKSREGTLQRKNSKKKKSDTVIPNNLDEIDKALYEIKLLDDQEKNRSLKRRSSKKKHENYQTEEKAHVKSDSATNNLDLEQIPISTSYVTKNENEEKNNCSSSVSDNISYLNDLPDDEEIECLKEECNSVSLPIANISEAWIDEACQHSSSDEEIKEPNEDIKVMEGKEDIKESTQRHFPEENKDENTSFDESNKDIKTREALNVEINNQEENIQIKSSLGLPMTESSDAWMDDFGEGGFSDSDDEREAILESSATITCANENHSAIDLPTSESSDACGGDSEGSNSNCEKSLQATSSGKRKEEETIPVKSSLGLPMADASDAWMNDVGEGGFSESDDEEIISGTSESSDTRVQDGDGESFPYSEEENMKAPQASSSGIGDKEETIPVKSGLGLPMADASDAWMDDVGEGGFLESDDEEINTHHSDEENKKDSHATSSDEGENLVKFTLGLPMADASDAWMDDVGEGGFSESDNEEIISGTHLPEMQIEEDNNNGMAEVKSLPITESSEAWMDEVVGGSLSDSNNCQIFASEIQSENEKIEENVVIVQDETFITAKETSFKLPMTEAKDDWMADDFGQIDSDESDTDLDNLSKAKEAIRNKIEDFERKINAPNKSPSPLSLDNLCATNDDGVSGKRISAFQEAQVYTCNDEDDECIIIKEESVNENIETTSWAFVASKESVINVTPTIQEEKPMKTSNPALIVEIIEKEPKEDEFDSDGYKIVKKNLNKMKIEKPSKSSSSLEEVLNVFDQPIEENVINKDPTTLDDFIIIESQDIDNIQEVEKEHREKQEIVQSQIVRKSELNENYTLDVKVSTKETCLGRRLHKDEATEWKMDIQCVQKDVIPDIVEGVQQESEKLSTESGKSDNTFDLLLSPSWMRKKDFARTQSEENLKPGGIFGPKKERKGVEARKSLNLLTDDKVKAEETNRAADEDEDVYWRIKHKVKKKKRRTYSENTEKCDKNEDFSSNPNMNAFEHPLEKEIEPSSHPKIKVDNSEESKMESATEIIRESSPQRPRRPQLVRQNSAEMQQAVEVQRPMNYQRKPSTSLEIPGDVMSVKDVQIISENIHNIAGNEKNNMNETETRKDCVAEKSAIASDAWMDEVVEVDFLESDEEKTTATEKCEDTDFKETVVDQSTISLPMTDTTDAWMDDVEGIGFSDSEKEDEKPIVAEVTKNTVAENSSISLPMTEASEAWMDDIGEADFSESEGEEEQKNPVAPEVTNDTGVEETKENDKDLKNTGGVDQSKIGLPMTEASDAWMDDVGGAGLSDSDEGKEDEKPIFSAETRNSVAEKGSISLPMTEASDAWMDDTGEAEFLDSDEEEETINTDAEEKGNGNIAGIKENYETNVDKPTIGLPMTEASDVWMDDVGGTGFSDSDEEKEKENPVEAEETKDTAAEKSPIFLPMAQSSDAWMDDVVEAGYSHSENESKEEKQQIKELDTGAETSTINHPETEASAGGFEDEDLEMKEPLFKETSKSDLLVENLSKDSFWLNKHTIDDAEDKLFQGKTKNKYTSKIKEVDDDNNEDDNDPSGHKKGQTNKETDNIDSESSANNLPDLEPSDFVWSDESTYLQPNIPVLKPLTFKMTSMTDGLHVESSVSKSANSLSTIIKENVIETNCKPFEELDLQKSSIQVAIKL